jgi:hypothetical protein
MGGSRGVGERMMRTCALLREDLAATAEFRHPSFVIPKRSEE